MDRKSVFVGRSVRVEDVGMVSFAREKRRGGKDASRADRFRVSLVVGLCFRFQ